ncbi:MAG: gluconokinase [Leptothrix sp. (in: b-proteobacteria)]
MNRASIVVMGVAGCGKSSLGRSLADELGLALVEGDEHHSAASRAKMQRGMALTDADREGWLAQLAALLRDHPEGLVMTCSALRRVYREQLRAAAPGLCFVFLDVSHATALARVSQRPGHFFSASLVDSQFATLEDPRSEAGVLRLDAALPLAELVMQARSWLSSAPAAAAVQRS